MRTTIRPPLLLNLAEKLIGLFTDKAFDFLNDYTAERDLKTAVNTSLGVTFLAAVILYQQPPTQTFPLRPSLPSFLLERGGFETTSFERICLSQRDGEKALAELTGNLKDAYIIGTQSDKKEQASLIFDKKTGDWGVFSVENNKLCHRLSGKGFEVEHPSNSQNWLLWEPFGKNYLEKILPAKGNLPKSGMAL